MTFVTFCERTRLENMHLHFLEHNWIQISIITLLVTIDKKMDIYVILYFVCFPK